MTFVERITAGMSREELRNIIDELAKQIEQGTSRAHAERMVTVASLASYEPCFDRFQDEATHAAR